MIGAFALIFIVILVFFAVVFGHLIVVAAPGVLLAVVVLVYLSIINIVNLVAGRIICILYSSLSSN